MSKKTKISTDELEAFYTAIAGTKPLIQNKIPLKTTLSKPPQPITTQSSEIDFDFNETNVISQVGNEDYLSYHQPGISHKMLRKLRKGQYNVEASLDLHGMSVENAKIAVENFLKSCLQCHLRVVLVIHGKGRYHTTQPTLKNKLNQWLRGLSFILAFCSAATSHGGRGAIYLLLKRERGSSE